MDEIYEWIKNIVIYMILNTVIMNLLGNSSYKKYVSIVSGMILVLIVISPLIKFLNIEEQLDYFFDSNRFVIEASDFENSLVQMEEQQRDEIFTEYKGKIRETVEKIIQKEGLYLLDFDVTIEADTESEKFGEILQFNIKASYNKSEEITEDSLRIDPVIISKIEVAKQEEKQSIDTLPSPDEINIKNKLSDFYNIEADNINISIQGGNYG